VNLENMFVELGRDDGIRDGLRSGSVEGSVLGRDKGFQISREVGFYSGYAEMWLRMASLAPDRVSEKAARQLHALQSLTASFPVENHLNAEILDMLERVRAKVKVVSSLLGIPIKYSLVDKPALRY